jgi:hypothetical protein
LALVVGAVAVFFLVGGAVVAVVAVVELDKTIDL